MVHSILQFASPNSALLLEIRAWPSAPMVWRSSLLRTALEARVVLTYGFQHVRRLLMYGPRQQIWVPSLTLQQMTGLPIFLLMVRPSSSQVIGLGVTLEGVTFG